MPITDKTRKILWARSGNRCAICRVSLVVERTAQDSESVVGEECHIVSQSPGGPRHSPDCPSDQIDEAENLILLCATHHKMVDDQQETYAPDVLRSIKRNHEAWVETKLCEKPGPQPLRVRQIRANIPSHLRRITSGKELLSIASGASAHTEQCDDDLSNDEVELVGNFIQELVDWVDMSSDLEATDRLRASKSIQDRLTELGTQGFYVFAAQEERRLEGGTGASEVFPVFHLAVLRATNPSIQRAKPEGEARS